MEEVKKAIKDLLTFDFDSEDVSDADKAELVNKFNDIITSKDEDVKIFVKSWFSNSLQLATENGMIPEENAEEENVEEIGNPDEEETKEESVESEEEDEEEEGKEESVEVPVSTPAPQLTAEQYTIKRANRYLFD